jgi:hypothetical protein
MTFDEIDQALDRLDHRYPRRNIPYSVEESQAILEAIGPLREEAHRLYATTAVAITSGNLFIRNRDEFERLLKDLTRFRLDADYSIASRSRKVKT